MPLIQYFRIFTVIILKKMKIWASSFPRVPGIVFELFEATFVNSFDWHSSVCMWPHQKLFDETCIRWVCIALFVLVTQCTHKEHWWHERRRRTVTLFEAIKRARRQLNKIDWRLVKGENDDREESTLNRILAEKKRTLISCAHIDTS